MATSTQELRGAGTGRLSVMRVGLSTAIVATVFFILCWLGARLGLAPLSHMYVQLFSGYEVSSALALLVGVCWSLVGGFFIGALFAWTYDLLRVVE